MHGTACIAKQGPYFANFQENHLANHDMVHPMLIIGSMILVTSAHTSTRTYYMV
jgi:hypothetical protein